GGEADGRYRRAKEPGIQPDRGSYRCDRCSGDELVARVRKDDDMGLNERRKVKELQDVTFPGRVKEIEEICGAPVPYEVDWDSLADDAEGLNYIDNISCHRLNMALRVICQDEMGKDAVRQGLKVIKLKNVKDQGSKKIAFSGGV